jgi:hypothetical protein
MKRDCHIGENNVSVRAATQHVIARYEAIPKKQSGYASSPCTVGDCFVPTHDKFKMGVMLSLSKHGG